MELPTALPSFAYILMLIAGGRVDYSLCTWRLSAPERKEGRRRTRGCATSAMWPAVGHGGRPIGRRVPTRRFDLSCSARARAAANIIGQAAGHRQVADKQGGAALPAPAGRDSSGGQLCEGRQNHDRRGIARMACVFIASAAKTAHLSLCVVVEGLCSSYSSSPGRRKPMRGLGSWGGFNNSLSAVNIICISSLFWKVCLSSCSNFSRISWLVINISRIFM